MRCINKQVTVWVISLIMISLLSCKKEEAAPGDNTPQVRPLTAREAETITTTNDFAFRLFGKINEAAQGQNTFISPFSVATAVTMAYNGAASTTQEGIRSTLGLQDLSDANINAAYQSLYALLSGIDKEVAFTSANSVWYRNTLQPQPDFVETNTKYLNAEVQGIDFSDPAAKSTINIWVSQKTQGKIPEMVQEIRPEHVMFLLNAVYFKGNWTYKFDKRLTQEAPFYSSNGATGQAKFMHLTEGKFLLHQDVALTLVDLPYGNKQYSMTLIMPGQGNTIEGLLSQLSASNLQNWLDKADSSSLELFLPKFKLEYEKTLNEILAEMGMAEAFTGQADFSRMLSGYQKGDLQISQVKHKTYIEVDEEGTEAAGATSIGIVVTSLPPSIRFDHPFVFMIREKASGAVLFMGKLMQP